jgi:hypothetical protein
MPLFAAQTDAPPWLVPAIIIGFPLVFIPMWCGIVFTLSRVSGWSAIAARFPGSLNPPGTSFDGLTGTVGIISYRNALTVHFAPEGLHVMPWKIFRIGHAPVFIPWGEIHNARTRNFPFFQVVAFEIGSPKVGNMQLPQKVMLKAPISVDGKPAPGGPPPLP